MAARVLSIQSHVVSGYVGNKAATFPLQLLGLDVDALNTVHFSNHTGYAHVKGQRLDGAQLDDIVAGLRLNGLLQQYTHVLTGYVGSASFLRSLVAVIRELKQANPAIVYVCDPVMGDHGRLYVPQEMVPLVREQLIPLADVVTPNQFELETLVGAAAPFPSHVEALAAIDRLHEYGPRTVVLTSSDFGGGGGGGGGSAAGTIDFIGSNRATGQRVKIAIPRLNRAFSGTGDLTAALLLAWTWRLPSDQFPVACEKVVASIQGVLKETMRAAAAEGDGDSYKHNELRLIQSKTVLENPVVELFSERV